MLGYTAFVVVPLVAVVFYSFQSRNLLTREVSWIGFKNYERMFTDDPLFFNMIKNSLVFTVGVTISNVLLALALALMLYRKLFGMIFFRSLFFAPVITSTAAWVIVWRFLLQGRQGTLNMFLFDVLGTRGPNWLFTAPWAMAWVIITILIKGVGLNMIILLAALKEIPRDIQEAAWVDGANPWQVLTRIILPLLSPAILLVSVLTIIGGLGVFDHIQLLTNGGPQNTTNVLSFYVYFQAFRTYEVGYASALAVLLFLIAMGLTLLQWSLRKRFVYSES